MTTTFYYFACAKCKDKLQTPNPLAKNGSSRRYCSNGHVMFRADPNYQPLDEDDARGVRGFAKQKRITPAQSRVISNLAQDPKARLVKDSLYGTDYDGVSYNLTIPSMGYRSFEISRKTAETLQLYGLIHAIRDEAEKLKGVATDYYQLTEKGLTAAQSGVFEV